MKWCEGPFGQEWTGLAEMALSVRERAYAPYSKFRVGCAIETSSGEVFVGCNAENASYPAGFCAEQGAIGQMVAHGKYSIRRVAIAAGAVAPCFPCGICLQQISEFADGQVVVLTVQAETRRFVLTDFNALLPVRFQKDSLLS